MEVSCWNGTPIYDLDRYERQEMVQFLRDRLRGTMSDEVLYRLDVNGLIDTYSLFRNQPGPSVLGSASTYTSRYKNVKSSEIKTCEFCDYKNRIDYKRLPPIAVLKCGNCGGIL